MTISEKRRWPLRAIHDTKPIMDVLLQRSQKLGRVVSMYEGRLRERRHGGVPLDWTIHCGLLL